MQNDFQFDVNFDTRSDTPLKSDGTIKDPDGYSKTLNLFHKLLWSKQLPNGEIFKLITGKKSNGWLKLVHSGRNGEFVLTSDAFGLTFRGWNDMQKIIYEFKQLNPREFELFVKKCSTIGGYIVFPGLMKIGENGKRVQTMNQARVRSPLKDRIDLALECIRLYYKGIDSPLSLTIKTYSEFFSLFNDFEGYTKFFLLDDLVSEDFLNVRFFLPFDGFKKTDKWNILRNDISDKSSKLTDGFPRDLTEYKKFKTNMMNFIISRNIRINNWFNKNYL